MNPRFGRWQLKLVAFKLQNITTSFETEFIAGLSICRGPLFLGHTVFTNIHFVNLTTICNQLQDQYQHFNFGTIICPHQHTAARLKFKACLWTLGLGQWFGLGQSFLRLESVGIIPELPRNYTLYTNANFNLLFSSER